MAVACAAAAPVYGATELDDVEVMVTLLVVMGVTEDMDVYDMLVDMVAVTEDIEVMVEDMEEVETEDEVATAAGKVSVTPAEEQSV